MAKSTVLSALKASMDDKGFNVAAPTSMTTAAFKVELKTYLVQGRFVKRCGQRMLEKRTI